MTMQDFLEAQLEAVRKDNQKKQEEIDKLYKIIFEFALNNPTEEYKSFIISELFVNKE